MFIRVKKVKKESGKEYEYAHLVHALWKKKRLKLIDNKKRFVRFNNSVHKYKNLLGRVYRFDNNKSISLEEFLGCRFEELVKENAVEKIYNKLIEYELYCCGFKKIKGIFHGGRLFVDLNRLIVHDGINDCVLKIQDKSGYLCAYSLNELFNIKKVSGRYEGMLLLKKLRMVGVDITPDNFFILVNGLLKD